MNHDLAWWQAAVAGETPPVHSEPECGYFKMRDRRGLNKKLAPIKRPWVACAIWRDGETGELRAELAGTITDVDRLWPYCAKHPISYEDYAFFHEHEQFPEEQAA